jgi:CRP-like cAMP-binding protein
MSGQVNLRSTTLFSRLNDEVLAAVAGALQPRRLGAGEILFNQGDPGDDLFIVEEGGVAIFMPSKEKPGQERPIRIFGPGEMMGEMALIDRQPRSLSARAVEPSRLLALTGADFSRLLNQYPAMGMAVMSGLSDRIRYTTDFLGEVQEWVRRVAAGEYERSFTPKAGSQDHSLATLAAEFAQMAAQVRKREEELRQQVEELRIQIDESKKQRQVGEIVESEYFQTLQARAKQLRKTTD